MKKLKVGLVGCRRGSGLVSVFSRHPKTEIAALCDLDTDSLAGLQKSFGLKDDALFTKFDDFVEAPIDIAVIATPIGFHREHTIKSLEAGKHVLCEQTAAYTVKDCEAIVKAVKKTKKTYMMAENYCYFHYVREWKKAIDEGKLGKIFYAEAEYIHKIIHLLVDPKTGKYYWRHERPPIWYCAHCLGPVLTLMGDRVVKAMGKTTGFNRMPDYKKHLGFLDIEVGMFQTEKGALIKILRSQTAARPHMVWYSLYGTKGYVENNRLHGDGMIHFEKDKFKEEAGEPITSTTVDPNAPEEAKKGGHGTSEYYMIRDFIEAIEKKKRPPIDVVRAMDFTVPGIIAHESAMGNGGWRDVPLFNW